MASKAAVMIKNTMVFFTEEILELNNSKPTPTGRKEEYIDTRSSILAT
jgi:hypothetical protein